MDPCGSGDQDLATVVARWRQEVRRVLPAGDPDLVEEVAQHVADHWLRARAGGASMASADEDVRQDLKQWQRMQAPRPVQRRRIARLATGWGTDGRYALRSLAARPLLALSTALLMALAVAATVTTFTIAYGVLWRPLPYPHADRLAVLWQIRQGEQQQVSFPDYRDISVSAVFDGVAAMMGGRGSLRIGERIERVNLLALEAPGYAMLGSTPTLGRLLHAGDGGTANVMISHRLWRHHLGSDPQVVGRVLWLSGRDHTVVGVLPDGFDFELPITATMRLEEHDLWAVLDPASPFVDRRDVSTFEVLVRLEHATTLRQAQATVDVVGRRLAERHAATNQDRSFRLVPLKAQVVAPVRRPLLLVCAAAAATLMIALANLITLALARMSERRTELAVRLALGAAPLRLRRQLFTENALVAAVSAISGFVLAVYLVQALVGAEAAHLPRVDAIRFDAPVRVFAAAIALLMALVVTLVPRPFVDSSAAALRAGGRVAGRSGRRPRQILVAGELSLAVALSAAGALLGLSLMRLFAVDPGFDPSAVAVVRVSAYATRYPAIEHVEAFLTSMLFNIRRSPGVAQAAAGSSLPLSGQTTGTGVLVEGVPVQPGSRQGAGWQFVTPGYFETLGMTIRRGRDFTPADRSHAGHVTVINDDLARALFGDSDPIGRRIAMGDGDQNADWHEIIGVVGGVRHQALDTAPAPRVYDLFGEHWGRTMYVVVKSRLEDPASALSSVRRTITQLDPEAPVFENATMPQLVDGSAASYRLAAALAGGLALCAVLLALVGVYAVAAAYVAERRREIGIRAALGASPLDLLRLVLAEGLWTCAAGGAAGIAASLMTTRILASQLFGINSRDLAVLLPVVCGLLFVAAVAAALPAARRAADADPLLVMQAD